MDNEINLLSTESRVRKTRRIFIGSIILFGAALFICIALFIVHLGFKRRLGTVEQSVARVEQSIQALTSPKSKTLILKERLGEIMKISSSRSNINERLTRIQDIVPSGTTISELETSDDQVILTVESSNLELLQTTLEENVATFTKEEKAAVQRVDMGSFTFDGDDGVYALTLHIFYKSR